MMRCMSRLARPANAIVGFSRNGTNLSECQRAKVLLRSLSASTATTTATATGDDGKTPRYWKTLKDESTGESFHQHPIFVAATRQHVGKTTVSLAIMSGLKKRFDKVGFLKPVGQQHVPVYSEDLQKTIQVDKDCCLVLERFGLKHVDYKDMSPVIIPRGYTKQYIDGEISHDDQLDRVLAAMDHVTEASDIVLCEGTGHCAVGSIVGVNNARVANLMGAEMILIANGGLGSAFDELELNRVLCEHNNVSIAGVIINKVLPEKYDQTKHYMSKAIEDRWGVPLLGCIPDRPFLGCPALVDLEKLFESELISGHKFRLRHYTAEDTNIVTTSLTRFLVNLRKKPSRTLYICHVTRDDLILGFLGECQRRKRNDNEDDLEAALLICGRKGKYQLSSEMKNMMEGIPEAPMMVIEKSTQQVMTAINRFTPKLNINDSNRVGVAVEHYEPYIDFDMLLERTRTPIES